MKKVSILLILLVVTCGGSSEETVAIDTAANEVRNVTTTSIKIITSTTIKNSVDIDSLYDFKLAELIKKNFKKL